MTRSKLSSFYLFILCLIGFTAPFWHVFHGFTQSEGLFGYKYMSSFLYALGNPVILICVGLLFLYATKFIILEYKRIFKIISYIQLFIGIYYLIAVLIPKSILMSAFGVRDYGNWVYYIIMIIMSSVSGILFGRFQKAIHNTEEALKEKIRKLVHFILNQRKNVKEIEVYEYEMLTVLDGISE